MNVITQHNYNCEDQDLTKTKGPTGKLGKGQKSIAMVSGSYGNEKRSIPDDSGIKGNEDKTSAEIARKFGNTGMRKREGEDRRGMWTGRLRPRNGNQGSKE